MALDISQLQVSVALYFAIIGTSYLINAEKIKNFVVLSYAIKVIYK